MKTHLPHAPGATPRRMRPVAAAAAVLLAATTLTACSDQDKKVDSAPVSVATAVTPTPVAPELSRFYEQDVRWYPCSKDAGIAAVNDKDATFLCTTVTVPLDYSAPDGPTIQIALKKRPASKKAMGTLFTDPGGPGGSGVNFVGNISGHFSSDLLDSYDVIGFDPRGVGSSTAVDCLTNAQLDEQRSGQGPYATKPSADAAAYRASVESAATAMAQACTTNTTTTGLLDHIDTVSAAKDLDILRALSGSSALTYLGYSYGTYLGATYAELFPGNVGRMVLDGAVDPTLSAAALTQGQAQGFESALRAYVTDCLGGKDCPLTGDVDSGVKQIQAFLESTRNRPLRTADPSRPLTYSLAWSAVLDVLYQSEAWNVLSQGLTQAMKQDDGSVLLYISDLFASRSKDGTYSGNGDEVINAINCLDYPVEGDAAVWDQEAAELKGASPTFGEELAYSDLYCKIWGHTSTRERTEIRASGAAPILVVGTTGDPATPYAWSEALARQLDSGRLLTWEGNGHTAYGRGGSCVTDAVDTYLLTGQLPEEGLRCSGSK